MKQEKNPKPRKEFFLRRLQRVGGSPGVYLFYDDHKKIIYVGKAKNLRNRLQSYFQQRQSSEKVVAMVEKIHDFEVMLTENEVDALILENNLIKTHRPHYNILLRDDKAYPYLHLDTAHPVPRIYFYRGKLTTKGYFFGPFTDASSARELLLWTQRLFHLRSCDEIFFRNRSRPCLLAQIDRCSAPCVGQISEENYRLSVEQARLFLSGKIQDLKGSMIAKMQSASETQDYELAAKFRDQIQMLQQLEHKSINQTEGDVDFIIYHQQYDTRLVSQFIVRDGQMIDHKFRLPKETLADAPEEILKSFISEIYLNPWVGQALPKTLYVNYPLSDHQALEQAIHLNTGQKLKIKTKIARKHSNWERLVESSIKKQMALILDRRGHWQTQLLALKRWLELPQVPERIECFDISHLAGEATVASCVVFNQNGADQKSYRHFNIRDITKGDDPAALEQAMKIRFERSESLKNISVDVLLIDGGQTQVGRVKKTLEELNITQPVLLGISKGPDRRPGQEKLIIAAASTVVELPATSPLLHFFQFMRDEAHRFALRAHRKQRSAPRQRSILESIPGIGAAKRNALLKAFGGLSGISGASREALNNVPGIHKALADRIYEAFHPSA